MEFQTTLDTDGRQNDDLIQLITHQNKLFKLYVHVDHSYHDQSDAVLKNMTTLGTWENLTSFDVWDMFGGIDEDNRRIKIIMWENLKEFVIETITKYCKFIPDAPKEEADK